MSRSKKELAQITQLGSQSTRYVYDYDPGLLERFSNKHPSEDYMVMLNCPEFTSLCPKTGQPDFAEIRIAYIPMLDVRTYVDHHALEYPTRYHDIPCQEGLMKPIHSSPYVKFSFALKTVIALSIPRSPVIFPLGT